MKSIHILILLILAGVLVACNVEPSESALQTAVAVYFENLPTFTPYPTHTPFPTHTPAPTHTPFPTNTPNPTYTSPPTQTQYPTYTPAPTQVALSQPDASYSPTLGTRAEMGGYFLYAETIEDPATPKSYKSDEIGDNERLLSIQVVLGNDSGEPADIYPWYFYLVDSEGFIYEYAGSIRDDERDFDDISDISPGEKSRGWVSFIVPNNIVPAQIKFDLHHARAWLIVELLQDEAPEDLESSSPNTEACSALNKSYSEAEEWFSENASLIGPFLIDEEPTDEEADYGVDIYKSFDIEVIGVRAGVLRDGECTLGVFVNLTVNELMHNPEDQVQFMMDMMTYFVSEEAMSTMTENLPSELGESTSEIFDIGYGPIEIRVSAVSGMLNVYIIDTQYLDN